MSLDTKPISITSAFNAIKSFFLSQENNSNWQDLTTGAEGQFLMRLLANVQHVLSGNVITGRREVFQETANLMSSNIGIAVNNGYSVFRGCNQRRLITFIPNDSMTIPKYTAIGDYDSDHQILVTETTTFVAGQEIELKVLIGSLKEITWQAGTNKLKKFTRFEQNISEDIQIFLDGLEVPYSKVKKDEIYDMYYVYTNPWKSVTVEYLNNAAGALYKYDADSQFTLRYVELDDVESRDFDEAMFTHGKLTNTLLIENFVPFEDVEEIKINSPIYRETQNLVRSKADFADMVKQSTPNITQTAFKALTPTYTGITYIKDDFSRINEFQYKEIMKNIEPSMKFGRPLPDVIHPLREVTTLDITLGLTNRYTDEASVSADVKNIIDTNYANKLSTTINVFDIESLLNKLSYVKYSRANLNAGARKPIAECKLGDLVSQSEKTYRCEAILGKSGVNEPDWVLPGELYDPINIYTGLETRDNEVVWACYKRLSSMPNVQPWAPNRNYTVGDYVYSNFVPAYMFKCIDVLRASDINVPDVLGVEIGDYIKDGQLILLCTEYNISYPERVGGYFYRLGDRFNIGSKSFQYVGQYGITSGDEVLTFNDTYYDLYAFPEEDKPRESGYIYIDDIDASTNIHVGDVIRLNLVEPISKNYVEVSADNLVMKSGIVAKVKDYEDQPEEEQDEPVIAEEIILDLGLSYSGDAIPDITNVDIDDVITDGELTLRCIEYDYTQVERTSNNGYMVGNKFNISVYNEEMELVKACTFEVIQTPVATTRTSRGVVTADAQTAAEPTVQNANWKELEAQLKAQEQVHKWIVSEGPDSLRTPKDVLDFYTTIGKIKSAERTTMEEYYKQYDAADEEQIYLYMEQFGATRLEAVDALKKAKQLKEHISDASCLRYYAKDDEDLLVYVDRYFNNVVSGGYNVERVDNEGIVRIVRKHEADGTLIEEQINGDSDITSETYSVTVEEITTRGYNVHGAIKTLTRITPTVPVKDYVSGGITASFSQTDDGQVRWVQVENPEQLSYDWNVYTNFDINLTIKY